MKLCFILIPLFICITVSSCSNSNQTSDSEKSDRPDTTEKHRHKKDSSISEIINTTVELLQNHAESVNIDRRFAAIMKYFNHAAIGMANILLTKSKTDVLRKFVNEIITRRREEINEMNLFLREEPNDTSPFIKEFQKSVDESVSKMKGALGLQESGIDNLYIQCMIIFHQAVINIVEAELKYGSHQTLKIYARNILSAEAEELQQLESRFKQ